MENSVILYLNYVMKLDLLMNWQKCNVQRYINPQAVIDWLLSKYQIEDGKQFNAIIRQITLRPYEDS